MRDLNYQLKQLCRDNRDGSYGTQVQRERMLTLIANQLHELGYRRMRARSLKPKHIEALTKHRIESGTAPGTMKNRMSVIRWWAKKVNKQNVVARSNDAYGLPRRQYVSGASKGSSMGEQALEKVTDPHVRMSLELQRAFGLRREEAIKIVPRLADKGKTLWLKASWTKGGREREVPIETAEQRDVLDRARRLAGRGSLIPGPKRYVQQLRCYEGQCARAGLRRMHGLRHAYAQQRYLELTGWRAPVAGGPTRRQLTDEQRDRDQEARLQISQELGHSREAITVVYLGR